MKAKLEGQCVRQGYGAVIRFDEGCSVAGVASNEGLQRLLLLIIALLCADNPTITSWSRSFAIKSSPVGSVHASQPHFRMEEEICREDSVDNDMLAAPAPYR